MCRRGPGLCRALLRLGGQHGVWPAGQVLETGPCKVGDHCSLLLLLLLQLVACSCSSLLLLLFLLQLVPCSCSSLLLLLFLLHLVPCSCSCSCSCSHVKLKAAKICVRENKEIFSCPAPCLHICLPNLLCPQGCRRSRRLGHCSQPGQPHLWSLL